MKSLIKITLLCLFCINAHASVLESIYVGVDVGLGLYENNADNPSFTAYNGYVGYEFNDNISVDFGFSYLGESENTDFYGYGYGTWLSGNYNFFRYNDHKIGFSAGMASWHLEEEIKNGGQRNKGQSYSPLVGINYSYRLSDNTEAVLGYNYSYKVGDEVSGGTDIQWLSLGLKYKFGSSKQETSIQNVNIRDGDGNNDKADMDEIENEVNSKESLNNNAVIEPEVNFGLPHDWTISEYGVGQIALPSQQYKNQVLMFALQLKKYSDKKIEITGYTDDLDSNEYNELLSLQRANVVKYWLISEGIESNRIKVTAKGECCFKVPNVSDEARLINRRVEIKVYE